MISINPKIWTSLNAGEILHVYSGRESIENTFSNLNSFRNIRALNDHGINLTIKMCDDESISYILKELKKTRAEIAKVCDKLENLEIKRQEKHCILRQLLTRKAYLQGNAVQNGRSSIFGCKWMQIGHIEQIFWCSWFLIYVVYNIISYCSS